MVGFEGIKGVYPGFRVNPKQEQQRKQRDHKDKDTPQKKELKEKRSEDGKPHIDEFA